MTFGAGHVSIPSEDRVATHIQRGHIDEFVRLVAETFKTDEQAAETATMHMLLRQFEGGQADFDDLLDAVPGARDLIFAALLTDTVLPMRRAGGPLPSELFGLFRAYGSTHSGRPFPES